MSGADKWRLMDDGAPKDGTPILAMCRDGCSDPGCAYSDLPDPPQDTAGPHSLCLFHGHAEGMSTCSAGLQIITWGGAWDDSSWEYPNQAHMPDWWFRVGSEFEEAANPTHWQPLPEPPSS